MKLSIIVPVYNSEIYLEQCLSSLVRQTINEKEIIIINDASIDNSIKIIDKFKREYKDLIIVKNLENNHGVSYARNLGIEMARGEYIGFVDSDDFINEYMYEYMYKIAKHNENEIVVCGHEKIIDNNVYNKKINIEKINKYKNLNSQSAINMFLEKKIEGFSCDKIFKAKLLKENNITYPLNMCYEDMPFVFKAITLSESISILEDKFYYYRENINSFSRNVKEKNIYDLVNSMNMVIEICEKSGYKYNESQHAYYINTINYLTSLYIQYSEKNGIRFNYDQLNKICNTKKYKFIDIALKSNICLWEKFKYFLIVTKQYHRIFMLKNIIQRS